MIQSTKTATTTTRKKNRIGWNSICRSSEQTRFLDDIHGLVAFTMHTKGVLLYSPIEIADAMSSSLSLFLLGFYAKGTGPPPHETLNDRKRLESIIVYWLA